MILLPSLLLLCRADAEADGLPYYGLGYPGLGYRHYQRPSYLYPPAYSYSYLPRLQAAPVSYNNYNYHSAQLAPIAPTLPAVAAPRHAVGGFPPAVGEFAPAVRGVGPAVGGFDPAVGGVAPAVGRVGPAVGGVGPAVGEVAHSVAAVADVSHLEPHSGVTASQYHAQDEEGNYSFGYNNPNSARMETGNPHTGVRGSVSVSVDILPRKHYFT